MHEEINTFEADSGLVDFVAASTNFGERIVGKALDMVVLHYTGMKTAQGALDWLCAEEAQVSCHYFVFEDGRIAQLVAEKHRAWHAGNSYWHGECDINSRSIGIEIVNPGHEFGYVQFREAQMVAVVNLLKDIGTRRNIPKQNIVAHSDIAPTRKEDPGELFDWKRLYDAGLVHWIEPVEMGEGDILQLGEKSGAVKNYQRLLKNYGFEISASGEFDEMTAACTTAFQRRFRQGQVDGKCDASTLGTLKKLLGEH